MSEASGEPINLRLCVKIILTLYIKMSISQGFKNNITSLTLWKFRGYQWEAKSWNVIFEVAGKQSPGVSLSIPFDNLFSFVHT